MSKEKLIEGKEYHVTDGQGFTYLARWNGKNFETNQGYIIKNCNFVYY